MYIIKNAFRNITRAPGKSILIGIIVFIIGFSVCISLSIQQAAQTAKAAGEEALSVSASISVDRSAMMKEQSLTTTSKPTSFDFSKDLTLSELETYAAASSVKSFYYEASLSLNAGNSDITAVSSTSSTSGTGGGPAMPGNSGDFSLEGYSSEEGLTTFTDGSNTITSGVAFTFDSTNEALISEELATQNALKVGSTFVLTNPNNTADTYTFKVVGIYKNSSTTTGPQFSDPANTIYTSAATVEAYSAQSAKNESNLSNSTSLAPRINGTYLFADVASYNTFQTQATEMGLSSDYQVISPDIAAYEASLAPLTNLANFASTFVLVVMVIGGSILVIFNLLRIKERTYEIGVLSAIGMNKKKVAFQFITELFCITFVATLLSLGIGAVTSLPITNSLLASQSATTTSSNQNMGPGSGGFGGPGGAISSVTAISSVDEAMNMKVVVELLGVALVLTILSGGVAMISILRYDPLQILSERN